MTTLYQLEAANAPAGRALFERAGVSFDRPYWEAPFDGLVPSRLYLDHPTVPTSALLARTYDFFLAGEASPAIIRFLRDAPAGSDLYRWFYGFVPLTESWQRALPEAFPTLVLEDRRAFRLGEQGHEQARDWNTRIPDGVRVVPLDAALAKQADEQVPDVIGILWTDYDVFARDGWGYAALDEQGDVLSSALAVGLTAREVNIGVGTAERAQRRGLARLLCQACIDHAEKAGLEVTWDCDLANQPSTQLARALGFIEESPFLEFAFPNRSTPESRGTLWLKQLLDGNVTAWNRVEGES